MTTKNSFYDFEYKQFPTNKQNKSSFYDAKLKDENENSFYCFESSFFPSSLKSSTESWYSFKSNTKLDDEELTQLSVRELNQRLLVIFSYFLN